MRSFFAVLLLSLLTQLAIATDIRQISWDTLTAHIPEQPESPFDSLTDEQMDRLWVIAQVIDYQAEGLEVSAEELEGADIERQILTLQGLDVDALFVARQEVIERQTREGELTNPELHNQLVQMQGFFLPLEFNGQKVSEFLLVPYVGACIHEPPPPANQIVYGKLDQPIDPPSSLYTVVTVTGRMSTEATKPELSLVDGASQVSVGYQLSVDNLQFEVSH